MVGMSSRREKSIEAKRPDGYWIEKRGEVLGITEMPQQFGRHRFHENKDYVFTAGLPRIVYFRAMGDMSGSESVIFSSLRTVEIASFSSIKSISRFSDLEASNELRNKLNEGLMPNWFKNVLLQ